MSHTHRTHPLPQQSPGRGFSGGGGNVNSFFVFDPSSKSFSLSMFSGFCWGSIFASSAMESGALAQKNRDGSRSRRLKMVIVLVKTSPAVREAPRLMGKPTRARSLWQLATEALAKASPDPRERGSKRWDAIGRGTGSKWGGIQNIFKTTSLLPQVKFLFKIRMQSRIRHANLFIYIK